MTSYILENFCSENDIQYEWNISSLETLIDPVGEFYNVIKKIKWDLTAKLEMDGQFYTQYVIGELNPRFLDLNADTFIPYKNLTLDNVISWIEQNNPTIKESLKNELLNTQIYRSQQIGLPWEIYQSAETEEPAATTEEPAATTEEPALSLIHISEPTRQP
jgi:hypothetical protein